MSLLAHAVPRLAATVLLLRHSDDGFEIFMVRRSGKSAFMGHAMVFPGGRLDDADLGDTLGDRCDLTRGLAARRLFLDDEAMALGLLVAAVRETFEETGVLLACRDGQLLDLRDEGEAQRFDRWRERLNDEDDPTGFAEMILAENLTLAVAPLAYLAHWITPEIEPRRFDAHFLITRVPENQRPRHDAVETTASAWLTPRAALDQAEAGAIWLAPPTLRILTAVSRARTVDEALALRGGKRPAVIMPQAISEGRVLHLVMPGDRRYDPPGSGTDRVTLVNGRFVTIGDSY